MKRNHNLTLLLIVAFCIIVGCIKANAQKGALTRIPPPSWSITVTQDAKLAFQEDDFGNTPFTADLHMKAMIHGYVNSRGDYFRVGVKWQYADLNGNALNRWAPEIGYSIGLIYVKKGIWDQRTFVRLIPLFSYGALSRAQTGTQQSFEFGFDTAIDITNNFGVVIGNYWTERPELDLIRWNFNVGLQVSFN